VRFFTLASEAPPPAAAAASPSYSVIVGPVTVPELVDRPHFVLRSAPNRVDITEQARWAAPLKSEIPRVVADQLSGLLEGARTATSAQRATVIPDYRVLIDIQRFESSLQEGATVQALWTVRPTDGAAFTGRSLATEAAGSGYDDLVAAHSRALGAISRDIAAAITAARSPKAAPVLPSLKP
jgi:uncharacterized lipoprotein YmbA